MHIINSFSNWPSYTIAFKYKIQCIIVRIDNSYSHEMISKISRNQKQEDEMIRDGMILLFDCDFHTF